MLIVVQNDVLIKAQDKTDYEHEQAVETLRHLSWSIRRNHHLVFFPSLCQNDIDSLERFLNKQEIKAIQRSFSKKRDLQVILGRMEYHVEISFNEESGRNGNVIKIKPSADNKLCLFEKSFLLTENILDANFYRYLAIAYQKSLRIDECVFKTNYYPLQGGGATTKQVYILECESGAHFCLAILDSDKKWPNYNGYGETANEFVDEYNRYLRDNDEPINCTYYIMQNINEIENLIPLEILKHFSSPKQRSFFTMFPGALPWIDIKKGFDYRMLYNDNAVSEWKNVITTIDWAKIATIKSLSSDEKEYIEKVEAAQLDEVVKPWGYNILYRVLYPDSKHKNKYDLRKIDISKLYHEQRLEWDEIGKLVFNWCCCFTGKVY